MSGQEAVICPFCGAPYSGTIPYDVVDVKCRYCGGRILLPSHLSVVPRCPNHPDTVAVGLCSQCSQQFCKECLHVKQIEGGRTYLCARCLRARETENAWIFIGFGGLMLFFALVLLNTPAAYGGFVLLLIFSLPFIAYGAYTLKNPLKSGQSVQAIEATRNTEGKLPADVEPLYWRLWAAYARTSGPSGLGPTILERRIHQYMNQGMSREEAIRRLARIEKVD